MIVGSILLAFGIEAAWDERRANIEERENLRALLTDLDEVISEATLRIEQDETRVTAVAERLDSIRTAAPPGETDLIALLAWATNHRVIRARLDAYSHLVASGGITDIGDPQLRGLLARASYDLDLVARVSSEIAEHGLDERAEILTTAAADPAALTSRLVLHIVAMNQSRRFLIDRKREALQSATEARQAVQSAIGTNE